MRGSILKNVLLLCVAVSLLGLAGRVNAAVTTYSGDFAAQSAFQTAAGSGLGLETFDSFVGSPFISALPSLNITFDPNTPLPYVLQYVPDHIFATSQPNYLHDNGSFIPYVIFPDQGDLIYAIGLWSCTSTSQAIDQVQITAYDENDQVLGTVDTPFTGEAFAGLVLPSGASEVKVFELADRDGLNGIDNLQISTVPIPEPGAQLSLLAIGIVALRRWRRPLNNAI